MGVRSRVFKFLKTLVWGSKSKADLSSAPSVLPPKPSSPAKIPDDIRLYVVGDIHGRVDLLRRLHQKISQDSDLLGSDIKRMVVYLGDYIDRGDASKGVIDLLISDPLVGFESVYLKGNHEAEMEDFLANPTPGHTWTSYGGMNTALSYRVRVGAKISAEERSKKLRDELVKAMPEEHQLFFSGLLFRYQIGDYFLVHAGIRPDVPLDRQSPVDLLWMREPFLSHMPYHEKVIVHGHTISEKPQLCHNRIGLDTGAYYSGNLSCLVLEGETQRFLSTAIEGKGSQ